MIYVNVSIQHKTRMIKTVLLDDSRA